MLPRDEKIDSYTEFFSQVEPRLRGALTAVFGMDLGREICAETLAYGWEHWDRLDGMENPAGYLYRVGVARGQRLKPSYQITVEPRATDSPTWIEPGLPKAMASLSEKQRLVVGLVHGYGWSLAEVAEMLGVAKSTVQSHEQRAMKRLRRKLGAVQ